MALSLLVNGVTRQLDTLAEGCTLAAVVAELSLKADRVAIERNGDIAPRNQWPNIAIASGDRLEIVHFVGGGSAAFAKAGTSPERLLRISSTAPEREYRQS